MSIYEELIDQSPENSLPDTAKYIFLAVVFITTFISCLLPLKIISTLRNAVDPDRRLYYQRIVGALNCFAGGVFMGTSLLDLLPQVTSLMKKVLPNSQFPFAEFIVAFGLLLILCTEQIAIDCKEKTSDQRTTIERLQSRNLNLERETLTSANNQDVATPSPCSPNAENINSSHLQSKFNSILLLIALSLHSLFEGLTLGLLREPSIVLQVFVAILIHKVPIAFSLGLNLVQSELKISAVIQFDLWFSLMTPIGTGIGVILNTLKISNIELLKGILIGLSTGTFIYIVFVEILPKELKHGGTRLLNLLFLIIGFSIVCCAVLVETTNSK